MTNATCSIDGCEKPARSRGWCDGHYTKWRRHGSPLDVPPRRNPPKVPLQQRFDALWSLDAGGCWIWRGAVNRAGYGAFSVDGTTRRAHRVSYELRVGPIPEGLHLDHLCRVRACVNPAHLEPVTHAENVRRGARAGQTHCKRGHEFTPENTRVDKSGGRCCIACVAVRRGLRAAAIP